MGADIRGYVRSRITRVGGVLSNVSRVSGVIDDLALRVFSGGRQAWEYGTQKLAAFLRVFASGNHTMQFQVSPADGAVKVRDQAHTELEFVVPVPDGKVKAYDKGGSNFEFGHTGKLLLRVTAGGSGAWEFGSTASAALARTRMMSEVDVMMMSDVDAFENINQLERVRLS